MSQVDDYVRVLRRWRDQESRSVLQILQRITQTKTFVGQDLDDVTRAVTDFHREIGKAEEDEVDPKWFELSIALKKKLKKLQDNQKANEKPRLEKKPSVVVEFPEALIAGRGPNDQQILKSIYKNFLTHFEEAGKNPATVPFLQGVLRELKYMFEGSLLIDLDKTEEALHKRVNSICHRLARENSKEAKEKMLAGGITSKELACDDEELYFDEKMRENIRKNQLAQLEESRTGFYDQMKKNINKDACEECRFCHKKNAFCEDMKQIRASDEPMTRFMRCNACNKAWRD